MAGREQLLHELIAGRSGRRSAAPASASTPAGPSASSCSPLRPGTASASCRTDVGVEIPATLDHLDGLDHATTLRARRRQRRDRRAPALRALRAGRGRRAGRGGRARGADPRRQRRAVRDPDPRGGPASRCAVPRALPEGAAAGGGACAAASGPAAAGPEHFRVSYTIGFDHPLLRHQAVVAARHAARRFVERDRARAHLRLPARGGDAAPQRAGAAAAASRTPS